MARIQQAGSRIPRWTAPGGPAGAGQDQLPVGLAGELEVRASAALAAALRRTAEPLAGVLLAAHLKVLADLTGEPVLVTRYRAPREAVTRMCVAPARPGSWRELAAAAQFDADTAETASPEAASPEAAEREAAEREAVLDLSGLDGPGVRDDAPAALRVSAELRAGVLRLGLRYRNDVMTASFAERIGGYYLRALELIAADSSGPHHAQSLVGAEELHTQMHDLAGRRVPLPDKLFIELFEEQARERPEATAAVHNGRRWTYRELDERASQVARLLLSEGIAAEDVVAVCMSRNLDWLAALLGVLKSGGVYLPVRPDFPPDRVLTQLNRSACRFGLTAPGDAGPLAEAAPRTSAGCAVFMIEDARRHQGDGAATVPVTPGQLAYIYFTSGSTGEPKGAMCEHAGLLNHLYAKVDDLDLGPDDVVTQTASQCFDISLWQLAAPLLVGGCTEIIDTDLQLDVERFVGKLTAGGISVIQIVPAYLEVMLAHLERHPVPLGDLRSVSVTGEALKAGLVRRWFACYPDIPLVNAYGATEVSDDTMHAVLRGSLVRESPIVTVGRSLRNVNTYILNERLQVVPLGAPGEIAFSGVCVGRGYINDPERTTLAFVEDPYRPGTRLYRTGDFGRWLPEGTIEFLGRRDEQVKIRGFRIEIGEIENRLLQMPGVREAAVVIAGESDQTRHLVAFFTGAQGLQSADLRDFLAAALPDYMMPSYLHQVAALPLTENGKVAKRRLIELAGELSRGVAVYEPPATATERRLATAWAEILNALLGGIGRNDDFFKLGGTSLAAVRLVVKLDRLVSLRQLTAHPVLRDLAAVIDATAAAPAADPASADSAVPAASVLSGPLLQRLGTVPDARATLICFPYAGGNAVNFRALAKELERARVVVYGVELPGHDVARPDEPLTVVTEIADRVLAELHGAVDGPVLIWGHCAGSAAALALARLLERAGRGPERVFLGGALLDDPAALRREIDAVAELTNQQITDDLHRESAYVELDMLKAERSDQVGQAYRHDVRTANEYLIEAAGQGVRLRAPLDVVVAADDAATAGHRERHRDWEQLASTVRLHELDEGGHYFVRTRPDALADLITACLS
jgi:amino acid adenylation domain-containing protein